MKSANALSIDIGTSGVRGALYDDEGNEIDETSVRSAHSLLTTLGSDAEVYAEEIIEKVESVINEVLAASSSFASQIEIVAISCFWHSLVGIDQRGETVTPVYVWADTRAAGMVEELRRSFDERVAHSRTGCRFHPSYWPAKLLWLRQLNARAYRATAKWVSLSEVLMRRFFGNTAISVSMASGTGILNQRSCTWDEELLSYLGLSTEQLPTIVEDGQSFSGLIPKYAKQWPRLQRAKWFPAIGDGAANNVGAGCVTRERAALMIGTSGAMRIMWTGNVPETIPAELWCYRADRQRVVSGGALSDGGGLIAWMKKSLKVDGGSEDIELALDEMQPDDHGLTVLPFWSGERSTGWHASARGSIIGLRQDTLPIEILRASMEAIAYRFALIAESMAQVASQSAIVASGNALTSSPVWTQMLADVLGRPIGLSDTREASSRGAVLLALEMEGRIRDIRDVPVTLARTFEPDMTRHARYREGLDRQEELYARLIS